MLKRVQMSISHRVPAGTASVPSGLMEKMRAFFVVPSGIVTVSSSLSSFIWMIA